MNKLTEKQVDEINTYLAAIPFNQAVRVTIQDQSHYIASVTDNGATFLDGSNFDGGLEEMGFMDESPDDGINFEDLSQEEFEQFLQDVVNVKKIVPIVILVTEVHNDDVDGEPDENDIVEESFLIGHVLEKQFVDPQEFQYIAVIEYDPEKESWQVLSYHPSIIQENR